MYHLLLPVCILCLSFISFILILFIYFVLSLNLIISHSFHTANLFFIVLWCACHSQSSRSHSESVSSSFSFFSHHTSHGYIYIFLCYAFLHYEYYYFIEINYYQWDGENPSSFSKVTLRTFKLTNYNNYFALWNIKAFNTTDTTKSYMQSFSDISHILSLTAIYQLYLFNVTLTNNKNLPKKPFVIVQQEHPNNKR